jgi:tetratricopeptide (TPR) repeat protein
MHRATLNRRQPSRYTQPVHRLHQSLRLVLALFFFTLPLAAQQSPSDAGGRVVLVLPFDNRSGQANLSWIGDSFPDTLNQRLTSAGFLTITRDDRLYALDHLGYSQDFKPTHATTIRIAQTLDANFVILGSYNVADGRISAQAQVLDIQNLHMSAPLEDSAPLDRLFDVQNAIAWKIARQLDPKFTVAEQTFLAAPGQVKLSAFENYIRGVTATTPQERIKRLTAAVQEIPTYAAALLALGKTLYTERQFDQAATTLAKIPDSDQRSLEAHFYIGLARFNSARYADAEAAFTFVVTRLPLPEVINNQAVAISRQGRDAAALFQRAVTADPNDADYHYNLAVSLLRRGDFAGAQTQIDAALKLHPNDAEATELKTRISQGRKLTPVSAKSAEGTAAAEPLERIRRSYSETSFRQAAFQLDQMRALRMSTLPPAEQATQYTQLGYDYLAQGLILEAEQQFQSALAADPNSSAAHAGLAQVREQSGNLAEARSEAQSSLKLKPNAAAFLVLARVELHDNQTAASAADVAQALKLEPNNSAALGMKQALAARGQSLP